MPAFELKDHLKLETWANITSRPAYKTSINAKKISSCRVKGIYTFKDQDACCGASACQKNHNKGFLVAYSGDKESSLCESCAQQFLNVTYEAQAELLKGEVALEEQKITLNTFLKRSQSIKDRIKEIKQSPYGANWLYKSLNNFRKAYPAELLTVLTGLANTGAGDSALNDLAENDADRSQIEQDEQLQGLGIFNADIKEVLISNILKPLKKLEGITESQESPSSLGRFCK